MNNDWNPAPARDRLIVGAFVALLVLTAIGLALFVRLG